VVTDEELMGEPGVEIWMERVAALASLRAG
jgi:hypothetical protein